MEFKSLGAFRGIAAIMVVLFHSSFYSEKSSVLLIRNSDLFVDFFFILSGFVMSFAYQEKIGNEIGFKRFFVRRFARLYPLHIFMLLMWLLYKLYLFGISIGKANLFERYNIFAFVTNIFLIQSLGVLENLTWNYPSWSISTEFYTYMIFYAYIRIFSDRKSILKPAVVSIFSYAIVYFIKGDMLVTYDLGFFRCIGGFFAGVVVFRIYMLKEIKINNMLCATSLEVFALGFMMYFVAHARDSIYFIFLSIFSFMQIVYLFSIQGIGVISMGLKTKIPQYIGRLSYSIYMIHALVLLGLSNFFTYRLGHPTTSFQGIERAIVFDWANYLNAVIVLSIIIISTLSFEYIENPWRNRFRSVAYKL